MSLTVNHVKKSFYQGQKEISVLKDISFSINNGEKVALLGKSGSGKSTILNLLSGILKPDSGNIIVNGKDITALSSDDLSTLRNQEIGIIFQQFHLVPYLTSFENVCLPFEIRKDSYDQEFITKLLSLVEMSARAEHYPDTLSGGEKQRVAIARCLAISPSIILADEPSGSLDEETGQKVMDLLFKLELENQSLLLITHDKELASRCDRILVLEDGHLREQ